MDNNYEVLIPSSPDYMSVILPVVAVRGLALAVASMDTAEQITAKLAMPGDKVYIGNLTRDVATVGGPTTEDQLFGTTDLTGRLESPDQAGELTSCEDPIMVAYESPLLATVADDSITAGEVLKSSTPLGKLVNFKNGKPKLARSGEYAHYELLGASTPTVSGNALRVVLKRVKSIWTDSTQS